MYPTNYKPGDKVICVSLSIKEQYHDEFIIGQEYEVKQFREYITKEWHYINGRTNQWCVNYIDFKDMFELVTVGSYTSHIKQVPIDPIDANNAIIKSVCDCPMHGPSGILAIGCRKGHR